MSSLSHTAILVVKLTCRAVRHEQLGRIWRGSGTVQHGLLCHRVLKLLLLQERWELLIQGAAVHRWREVPLCSKGLKEAGVILVKPDVSMLKGSPTLTIRGISVCLRGGQKARV
jgi:hypothetical protein